MASRWRSCSVSRWRALEMREEGWHGTVNWNWNHAGEEVEKQVVEVGGRSEEQRYHLLPVDEQ